MISLLLKTSLVALCGWAIAMELPKTFPKRVAEGSMTADQAKFTSRVAKVGGVALVLLAVAYFVFCMAIRS